MFIGASGGSLSAGLPWRKPRGTAGSLLHQAHRFAPPFSHPARIHLDEARPVRDASIQGPSPEEPKPEGPRLIIPRELLAFPRQCPRYRVPGNPPNGSDARSTIHPKASGGLKLW